MRAFVIAFALLLLSPVAGFAASPPAHPLLEKLPEEKTKSFRFDDAFVRSTPAHVSAGYVIIHNPTAQDDALTGASADWADHIQLHTITTNDKGVMQMKPMTEMGLPAGGDLALRPGGMHMMIFGLKRDLRVNETVTVTLVFRNAGAIKVPFKVRPLSYKGQ